MTAPFAPDEVLIARARNLAASLPAKERERRETILDLLSALSVAVDLSGGPVPERSAHWHGKALEAQGRLRGLVGTGEAITA